MVTEKECDDRRKLNGPSELTRAQALTRFSDPNFSYALDNSHPMVQDAPPDQVFLSPFWSVS